MNSVIINGREINYHKDCSCGVGKIRPGNMIKVMISSGKVFCQGCGKEEDKWEQKNES